MQNHAMSNEDMALGHDAEHGSPAFAAGMTARDIPYACSHAVSIGDTAKRRYQYLWSCFFMSVETIHEKYMRIALDLAAKGIGTVNPNPMVGAVIVKHDKVIGQGYHSVYGGPHAEIEALKNCSDATGATLYVTLEPCCHHGKTPPCTDAIIKSKISKVVIGCKDPNTLVSGKGIEILKNHGIEVETGVLEKECRDINEVFFYYIKNKKPYVVMKYAMSADGKIATSAGESKWITGDMAREHTHKTRHALSAIMVGIGTVLADDPLLTCRINAPDTHGGTNGKNPVRIICDTHLKIPINSKIVQTAKTIPTIVAVSAGDGFYDSSSYVSADTHGEKTKRDQLKSMGITILETKVKNKKLDLEDLLTKLGEKGIDSILLEGGGTLNYSALEQGIVNKVQIYIGAKIFGGKESLSPVEGEGIRSISKAVALKLINTTTIDEDVLLEYNVEGKQCLQE